MTVRICYSLALYYKPKDYWSLLTHQPDNTQQHKPQLTHPQVCTPTHAHSLAYKNVQTIESPTWTDKLCPVDVPP